MKVNEIKETIERVVRTEYVAEDGAVFYDENECKKYEESALFAVSKELKHLGEKGKVLTQYDINEECSCDCRVEIFDVQTDKDLENLGRYLYLKAKSNGANENDIKRAFNYDTTYHAEHAFVNVTKGHEVIIFWNYEEDWFWVYKDGSIEGYLDYHRNKMMALIKEDKTEETE